MSTLRNPWLYNMGAGLLPGEITDAESRLRIVAEMQAADLRDAIAWPHTSAAVRRAAALRLRKLEKTS